LGDLAAVKAMLPKVETSNAGFIAFILTAMFWGAVTLMTPCVFPMIPITVSFFLKQGEKKQHNPLTMALVYTLTIIVVLGIAALFFLTTFRALSINPWMNAALALLFVFFALSLFGMYDIVLPRFLVRFTSSREGSGGYGGVVFMALSFSIVSFTCVAPFLGGFAGMAASGKFSDVQLAAGAFAFAGTFAAPFFLLALFPTFLKKLPKSGGWMNTIKVVMGFLELAAALKFFRTAELRWTSIPSLFTYDLVLSIWIMILFLAGLYLLNLYRLPHDEPQEHIGVTRMLFALMSISVGLYLLPGLFASGSREKQRPSGTLFAWVDAFLLPEPSDVGVVGGDFAWSGNLLASIEDARSRNDTVFIDFTGKTCTNCKLNEKQIFSQPKIKDLLKKFRLVQMYTDEVPEQFFESPPGIQKQEQDAAANLKFQKDVFRTEQLPLYVLLRPEPGSRGASVRILGIYDEGKINRVENFEEFLKKGTGQ
jgi:thiol:disulfide interchange protein